MKSKQVCFLSGQKSTVLHERVKSLSNMRSESTKIMNKIVDHDQRSSEIVRFIAQHATTQVFILPGSFGWRYTKRLNCSESAD